MNGAVRSQPPQIVLAPGNSRGSSIVANTAQHSTAQAVRAAINTAAVAASLVLPIGGLRRDHNAEMLKGGVQQLGYKHQGHRKKGRRAMLSAAAVRMGADHDA
jgi:hypothetical protein